MPATLRINQLLKPRVLVGVAITSLVGLVVLRTVANRLGITQLNDLIDRGI